MLLNLKYHDSNKIKTITYVGLLAEAVRFELTNGCPLPVFKTGAIDHSATLPGATL